MLLQFSVENYGPFREKAVLNMVPGEVGKGRETEHEKRDVFSWETEEDGLRVMCCAAVYGANCSGKSTLIRAMYDAQRLIVQLYYMEYGVYGRPFGKSKDDEDLTSRFEFNFLAGGDNYVYSFSLSSEGVVVSERLIRTVSVAEDEVLFCREEGEQKYQGTMFGPLGEVFGNTELIAEHRHPKQLLLPGLKKYLRLGSPIEMPFAWFKSGLRVLRGGWPLPYEGTERPAWRWEQARPTERLKRDERFREFALELLRKVGIPPDMERTESFVFFSELDEEPRSVRHLLRFAYELYGWKEQGRVLVIDDFGLGLHPSLTRYLLRDAMGYTGKRKQFIFTTHDPLLLSSNWDDGGLPRESVWFVDKSEQGESSLYPFTSFRSEQTDKIEEKDLWKAYLIGRFGGVPFLPGVCTQRQVRKEE